MAGPDWRTRWVRRPDVVLHVKEAGDPDGPTVVLVHGYPDTSAVWDHVAEHLVAGHHVVVYDVRGMGRSSEPAGRRGYDIGHLADDLVAVIDASSPDRSAHVVGHDWGSIQAWEAVVDPTRNRRIASYTTMSGPCRDHVAVAVRARLRSRHLRDLGRLANQALRSSYVAFFQVPRVPAGLWRLAGERLWRRLLAREGVPVDACHPGPTLVTDGRRGIELYRQNIRLRTARVAPRSTDVPVQLVVLERDPYVTPLLLEGVERFCSDLRRTRLAAGHWAPCTHPAQVAELIAEHVAVVERPLTGS
jgi:pimeloyl-ACP methyl ester carboxylesterase